MTPDQVLRLAAQHWLERLLDGEASGDWDGFDRDLETALERSSALEDDADKGGEAKAASVDTHHRAPMIDADQLLEWLDDHPPPKFPRMTPFVSLYDVRDFVLGLVESP